MNLAQREEDFYKRWKIEYNINPTEEFEKFRIRLLNMLDLLNEKKFLTSIFFHYIGKPCYEKDYKHEDEYSVYYLLLNASNDKVLIYLESLINDINYDAWNNEKGEYIEIIKRSIELSNVDFTMVAKDDEILFYPKGVSMLDEELVNKTLNFLDDSSDKHFKDALNFYTEKNHIKSAESLRRTIEQFLKYKLKSRKNFENNFKDLLSIATEKGVYKKLRDIIQNIFAYLEKYFNEQCKHEDGDIDDAENEFLIYQVGLLLRYINSIVD